MKKLLSVILVLSLVAVVALCLTACEQNTEDYTYVSLKINPDVDFIVDEEGSVVSYNTNNEDAEVLLSNTDLKGMSIEDATEKVLALAIEAGYLDVDTEGDSIELSVLNADGECVQEQYDCIKKNLNEYFVNNGIFGSVSQSTLDQYLDEAAELGVSVGRVKILMLACDRAGITLDEAREKTNGELMKMVNNGNGKRMRRRGNQEGKQDTMNQKCESNKQKLQNHYNNFQNGDCDGIKAQIRNYQNAEDNK